ncbi:MAG: hypothetical protein RIQ54_571 [Candidatus Parcubacteria bacterium]|jgi:hypothetical protein
MLKVSMKRLIKQLAYGIFYAVVIAAVVVPTYYIFIRPAPSCTDQIRNQSEEGVDCGGPCKRACVPSDIRGLETVSVPQAFAPKRGVFSVIARIQNPNLAFAARQFTYTFRIFDIAGSVTELSGVSHSYAGEVKYITSIDTSGAINIHPARIARIEVVFSNPTWVPASEFAKPSLRMQEFQASSDHADITTTGKIINEDALDFRRITLVAILYGRFGQIVGFGQTNIDNVRSNEIRQFSIIHPVVEDVVASSTQVIIIPPAR